MNKLAAHQQPDLGGNVRLGRSEKRVQIGPGGHHDHFLSVEHHQAALHPVRELGFPGKYTATRELPSP